MVEIDFAKLEEIVRDAGKLAQKIKNEEIQVNSSNPDNLQTNADVLLHQFYIENLPKILNVPILSEEGKSLDLGDLGDKFWIVDPIDGTLSYLHGYPTYVTQLALMAEGLPIISFVYAPELNLMYHAKRGAGAFCNGKSVRVSEAQAPKSIIDNYPSPNPFVSSVIEKLSISEYLESGSIGLKICRVADSTADIFIKNTRVFDWDVAPGYLVLEEAGGKCGLLSGESFSFGNPFRKGNFQALNRTQLYNLEALF